MMALSSKNRVLNAGDPVSVFSRSENAWFEGHVKLVEDEFVKVEWTADESYFCKTLHLHSDDISFPSAMKKCSSSLQTQTTVLSLNMEFNTRMFDGEERPGNVHLLKRCVQDADADVVALQEAVDYPDKARDPVLAALRESGYEEIVSTTSGTSDDGRTERALSFEGMIYGKTEPQALIETIRDKRKPSFVKDVTQDDNHPLVNKLYVKKGLSVKSSGSILVSPAGMVTYWPEKDAKRPPTELVPRFLAYVEVDFGGKSVFFLNTHFVGGRFEDTDFIAATEYRAKQSEAISRWAKEKAVVLVGDFNASQDFSLNNEAFLLKYANALPMFTQEKTELTEFVKQSGLARDTIEETLNSIEQWVISKYDKYMTTPMDSLRELGWNTTTNLNWSSKGNFPSNTTKSRPVYSSKFNTLVDHAFWRGPVKVKSIEVLWALAFAVNEKGEAKSGESDMDSRNGFTDHNGVLVTIVLR